MTAYQPNIPTGLVNLDVDYQNIQGNFQQLETTFSVDHIPITQSAQNGYHTSIHLNPVSTTSTNLPNNYPPTQPSTTPGYGQLYSAQINDGLSTDQALFFLTGGGKNLQLTSNLTPSRTSNGYTFLPGGIILQWGTSSSTGSTTPITFPIPFNTPFTVVGTRGQNSGSDTAWGIINITTTGFNFTANSSSAGIDLRWIAIGI